MSDPILQDKRQEHVMFQKYAVALMERVSGKTAGSQLEVSFANIYKVRYFYSSKMCIHYAGNKCLKMFLTQANVVAQTKIQYNTQQLFQIIHQHLLKHGMKDTASMLQKEANLPAIKSSTVNTNLSPYTYKTNKVIFFDQLRQWFAFMFVLITI